MSREQIQRWAEATIARKPRPYYTTGKNRFGPDGFDCSGFTYMGYRAAGLLIPADSASVARWGRDNGQVWPVTTSKLCDLLVHDKKGDPYNSYGPRGHIGLFVNITGGRVITFESAGGGKGVGVFSRPLSFWAIRVQHPAFVNSVPEPPEPVQEDEMYRVIKGDQFADLWWTDFLEKRHIGQVPGANAETLREANALIASGATNGAGIVTWPQAWVNNIPERRK